MKRAVCRRAIRELMQLVGKDADSVMRDLRRCGEVYPAADSLLLVLEGYEDLPRLQVRDLGSTSANTPPGRGLVGGSAMGDHKDSCTRMRHALELDDRDMPREFVGTACRSWCNQAGARAAKWL